MISETKLFCHNYELVTNFNVSYTIWVGRLYPESKGCMLAMHFAFNLHIKSLIKGGLKRKTCYWLIFWLSSYHLSVIFIITHIWNTNSNDVPCWGTHKLDITTQGTGLYIIVCSFAVISGTNGSVKTQLSPQVDSVTIYQEILKVCAFCLSQDTSRVSNHLISSLHAISSQCTVMIARVAVNQLRYYIYSSHKTLL